MEFKRDRIIDPTPRHETIPATYMLKDYALKYYDILEPIVNDLASRCVGGEECRLVFPAGRVTIKLR